MFFDFFKKKKESCKTNSCSIEKMTPKTNEESLTFVKEFKTIEVDEALKLYETQKDTFVWLDVRTYDEYNSGHIPGVKHIPIDEIKARLIEVGNPDQKYIVLCHSGGRSANVCHFLSEKGFKNLTNYSGGMSEWRGPVE